MVKKFEDLRKKMFPERGNRNKEAADQELLAMTLQELRTGVTSFNQEDTDFSVQISIRARFLLACC